ncbi:MAG: 30S ribosome-binding factor RbfA [Polyangia bacterium]|nr:30S ribosome-binding factor RbfA [Polyangia bacterium]
MSSSRRSAKVGAALRNALGELLLGATQDPSIARAGMISVTGVSVSGDLGVATVYVVSTSEDPDEQEAMLCGLERAAPFLRSEVTTRLNLRRSPELRFRMDESVPRGRRIESILEELSSESELGPRREPEEPS